MSEPRISMRRRHLSRILVGLVISVVVASTAGIVLWNSRAVRDVPTVEGEPTRALPVSDAVVIAEGNTSGGVPFEVLEYGVQSGGICVDFRYWYSADRDGDWGGPGACFEVGVTGWGGGEIQPSGETAVTGLLEGPRGGTGSVRPFAVEFSSGEILESLSTPRGTFWAVGTGLPVSLSYTTLDGIDAIDAFNEE